MHMIERWMKGSNRPVKMIKVLLYIKRDCHIFVCFLKLEDQIHGEEDLFLSMMNPAEREDYIRARNEERVRQRLAAERERVQREEELQAALSETKRMAAIRAAEIMAKELEKRSANSMYAELKNLVTEQKVSRAFTYSYFSLLQFLSSNSSNPAN